MHFEGEFRVPGKAGDVLKRFSDVPRMARCMPGAMLEPQAEDGSWPGAMVVSFGPKKINFKGRATCAFDHEALTGSVAGRGAADMRAARIGVKVHFALSDVPGTATPETAVKIVSDAELGGVLADFAKTGGIAVANVIMADFARRCAEEFSRDDAPVAATPAAPPEPVTAADGPAAPPGGETMTPPPAATAPRPAPEPVAPLQAGTLFWIVVRAYLAKLLRAVGLAR